MNEEKKTEEEYCIVRHYVEDAKTGGERLVEEERCTLEKAKFVIYASHYRVFDRAPDGGVEGVEEALGACGVVESYPRGHVWVVEEDGRAVEQAEQKR